MLPDKKGGWKPILIGRFKVEVKILELSKSKGKLLDLYQPNPKVIRIMENVGYNFKDKLSLNFDNEVRTQSLPFAQKGKSIDYYHMSKRGLGYISIFYASASESDGSVSHSH